MSPEPERAHRRYDPILGEWILCSPGRLDRPWRGMQVEPEPVDLPPHDPGCPLCAGVARASGARNPDYDGVFVFENDFPALTPPDASNDALSTPEDASGPGPVSPDDTGDGVASAATPDRSTGSSNTRFFQSRAATGRCRVVCFSPRHDLWLARMAVEDVARLVDAFAREVAALAEEPWVRYVQIHENRGALMGVSNAHPHAQIWALGEVPTLPSRKRANLAAHFDAHGSDLLGDYLTEELARRERVVFANEHWVVLVPYWAVWPFETLLLPRRRVGSVAELRADERHALADALVRLTARYDNLFRSPFPYSMGWQAAPTDGAKHPYWRLHIGFKPPLLRSATVPKFMVGFEMFCEPQRDLTPETAAAKVREASERHYLSGE
jgi:UDPglucose--hexose-1-phosphate uridylyltransferase